MIYSVTVRYEVDARDEEEAKQKVVAQPDQHYGEVEKVELRC